MNRNRTDEMVEEPVEEPVEETIEEPIEQSEPEIEEVVEPEPEPDILTGIVTGCKQLYVREAPTKQSEPVKVVNEHEELMIEVAESTEDFYKVYTASGAEGFCIKDFIVIRP